MTLVLRHLGFKYRGSEAAFFMILGLLLVAAPFILQGMREEPFNRPKDPKTAERIRLESVGTTASTVKCVKPPENYRFIERSGDWRLYAQTEHEGFTPRGAVKVVRSDRMEICYELTVSPHRTHTRAALEIIPTAIMVPKWPWES